MKSAPTLNYSTTAATHPSTTSCYRQAARSTLTSCVSRLRASTLSLPKLQLPLPCGFVSSCLVLSSVLWRCWLGDRKGIRPVKNWVVRCWHGYLSGARCRLAHAQLMPLPLTISCSRKIQIGFTFLVPAHLGSPGQRAVKRVCVCVCVNYTIADIKFKLKYVSIINRILIHNME